MATRRRSPIRLEKLYPDEAEGRRNRPKIERPIYKWVCDDANVRAAEFVSKRDAKSSVVLHRSTKRDGAGEWQVSSFDEHGAIGDSRYASCTKALNEHAQHYIYRLKRVVSTDGSVSLMGARRRRARGRR